MTPDMWLKVAFSILLFVPPAIMLAIFDEHWHTTGGDVNTISHAWAVLACHWQIVAPLFAFVTFGLAAAANFHLFVGRISR